MSLKNVYKIWNNLIKPSERVKNPMVIAHKCKESINKQYLLNLNKKLHKVDVSALSLNTIFLQK